MGGGALAVGGVSSALKFEFKTNQSEQPTLLCFCRRISQGYQEMGMDTKSHPPKKKRNKTKSKLYIYIYVYLCISLYRGHFAGTLCCTDLEISACLCLLHPLHRCSLCFRGKKLDYTLSN